MQWTKDDVREHREARKWTQTRLAAELGVSPRTIGAWENGQTRPKSGALNRVFADDFDDDRRPRRPVLDDESDASLVAGITERVAVLARRLEHARAAPRRRSLTGDAPGKRRSHGRATG